MLAPRAVAASAVVSSSGGSATRPQLIDEARAAHKAGEHLKAAGLFRRAADLGMTPSLEWALALEQEEAGAFADSYLNAQQCARDVTADRHLADRDRILRDCQDLELRLVPRIGYLVVEVTGRPEGSTSRWRGRPPARCRWGFRTWSRRAPSRSRPARPDGSCIGKTSRWAPARPRRSRSTSAPSPTARARSPRRRSRRSGRTTSAPRGTTTSANSWRRSTSTRSSTRSTAMW